MQWKNGHDLLSGTMKIDFLCDGTPPQDLSDARRVRTFLLFQSLILSTGYPAGAAAFIVPEEQS